MACHVMAICHVTVICHVNAMAVCLQFKFTERLIRQALMMIAPSDLGELSPEEAILLHHQFRVLAALTHYSSELLAFIQEKFYEEFK